MPAREITFDATHVAAIRRGSKQATIRYDGYASVSPGETYDAVTPAGERFATVRVTGTALVPARSALLATDVFRAAYPTESTDALLDALRGYYDGEIDRETPVTVLAFDVVD